MHKNVIIPLLCKNGWLYIHICLKMQLCLNMQFSTSFDITWNVEAAIYTFSHSIVCYFWWITKGYDTVNLITCDTDEWDEKCHDASDILLEWHHG